MDNGGASGVDKTKTVLCLRSATSWQSVGGRFGRDVACIFFLFWRCAWARRAVCGIKHGDTFEKPRALIPPVKGFTLMWLNFLGSGCPARMSASVQKLSVSSVSSRQLPAAFVASSDHTYRGYRIRRPLLSPAWFASHPPRYMQ